MCYVCIKSQTYIYIQIYFFILFNQFAHIVYARIYIAMHNKTSYYLQEANLNQHNLITNNRIKNKHTTNVKKKRFLILKKSFFFNLNETIIITSKTYLCVIINEIF